MSYFNNGAEVSAFAGQKTSASVTLVPLEMIGRSMALTSQTTATVTFPSAADLIAALAHTDAGNAWFEFSVQNQNSGTATIVMGTGLTLFGKSNTGGVPVNEIQAGGSGTFLGIVAKATLGSEEVIILRVG